MKIILPENLDKKTTLKNARSILSYCRSYKNVLGDEFTVTVNEDYTVEVVSYDVTETVIAFEAGIVLSEVFRVLNQVSTSRLRKLLYDKYLSKIKTKNVAIFTDLGISETHFYYLLDEALLEFSLLFNDGELLVFTQ